MLFVSMGLQAQTTRMVTNTNDAGLGSLRAAAISATSGDTIRFSPTLIASGSDSITLTSGEISFGTKGIIIKGLYTTTDTLYISGDSNSRIFSFVGAGRVVLDSLVLVNGNGVGGAIFRNNCMDTLFVINSTLSGNAGSLGGAIYSSSSYPSTTSSITIDNSTISGNSTYFDGGGIYSVSFGYQAAMSSVTINNSTISGNTTYGDGGGVYSYTDNSHHSSSSLVRITNSTISGNTANSSGGGIYSSSTYSLVTIANSEISGNTGSEGGAIYSSSSYTSPSSTANSSSVTIDNSTISGNTAAFGSGGGIYSYSSSSISYSVSFSSVSVNNSTISGNSTTTGSGGGIYSEGSSHASSFVEISNSTLTGNNANSSGGGIFSYSSNHSTYSPTITITNSTITGNNANYSGGGIYARSASYSSFSMAITNSTITGNTASVFGAGIYNNNPTSSLIKTRGSIIAENGSNHHGIYNNSTTNIFSLGYNIISDTITGTIASDSTMVTATQLNLRPLAFNGGTTQTMLPNLGSIAINNGNPMDISNAQNSHLFGVRDIGAAEYCGTYGIDTIATCDNFTWLDGVTYSRNNYTATHVIPNSMGCDSVITLALTITNVFEDTVSACDSFTWRNGVTYSPGSYTVKDTVPSLGGCDSIFILDLTVYPTKYSTNAITVCDSLTWIDGVTYYSNNSTATYTLTSDSGCDSIVTLDLTVLQPSIGIEVITSCDSYTWNGVTYTSSNNTAQDTLVNAVGCDSIVTLDLTIINSTSYTDVISSCEPITWIDGNVYSTNNNIATYTLVNMAGCDSVVTLDYTLLSTSGTDVISSCTSITWLDGVTYDQTTYGPTHIISNSQGCDSVITLDFTLLEVDISVTRNYLTLIAQATNATYQWIDCDNELMVGETNASFTATVNGNYQVVVTQNGCVDTSACFAITNVGVQEAELIDVNMYPNPTSTVLNIDKGSNQSLEITITNSVGTVVYQSTSKKQITIIDMAQMAIGIYVVTLKNEWGLKVEKVVKK